jgi:mannose-6-phosphate isomerase-like protein (cupin superfamily)
VHRLAFEPSDLAGTADAAAGRIAIRLDGEELVLGKGDCLYFSGETPHEVRSLGRQKAEVLVVVAQSPAAQRQT